VSGSRGYRVERLSRARRALAAGQELARKRHLMYGLVEADLTVPRQWLRVHRERTGEALSLTAYVVTCVARALAEFPDLNAFRRGRSLVYLDEIRAAQEASGEAIAGQRWLERVPVFAVPWLIRWMRRSIRWALRLGVAGVNNIGTGTTAAGWGLSPGAGTLAVTLGGITRRPGLVGGELSEREIAQVTLTVDHDVVDGAPAARFTARLLELLAAGDSIREATSPS